MSDRLTLEEALTYTANIGKPSVYVVVFRRKEDGKVLWTTLRDAYSAQAYATSVGGHAFKQQLSHLPLDSLDEEES